MFEYFMTTQDENLKQTNFWKGLADKTVPNEKPVDDLIDGFYVQECAFEKFKQSNKI